MNSKTIYTVLVGNIGQVYRGSSYKRASKVFDEYWQQSREGIGRASGESVTLMERVYTDEPVREYFGTLEND